MTKRDLLAYLDGTDDANALDVARAFGLAYPTAAMALLRLVRQGLAHRFVDPDRGTFWYGLSDRGQARLEYLRRQ